MVLETLPTRQLYVGKVQPDPLAVIKASLAVDPPPHGIEDTAEGLARPGATVPAMTDEEAMALALEEAQLAGAGGDVPVGAIVVRDGHVVAQAHNEREQRTDPTAHAEMLALRSAASVLRSWRLDGATVYVTLEPCPMCAGALVAARVHRLVFGASDPKAGACGSLYNLCVDPRLNHEVLVSPGVLAEQAAVLLAEFFDGRRPRSTPQ
jgi:tRNA(adenine34) deaminase